MLKVTFTETPEKLSLRLEGHAGYAETGKDIVCASASILAYTLANIVDNASMIYVGVKVVINLESGNTTIECECKDAETYASLADSYHHTKLGYELLSYKYPQYVRLIES